LKVQLKVFLAGAAGVLLGAFTTLYLVSSSSGRVIAAWKQPQSVDYASFDPYTLFVVETGVVRALLSRRATHELRINRGAEPNGYGHYVHVSLDFDGDAADEEIKAALVTWAADGVSFEMPTGHRLFVPKGSFIGGR